MIAFAGAFIMLSPDTGLKASKRNVYFIAPGHRIEERTGSSTCRVVNTAGKIELRSADLFS
ncbi:hypothetical protein CKK33_01875 [Mucilaginibacter sp. MD40]|nr:hypothetical protein CKK33_01875 [Mucilaginibacter sp. MD40]